MTTEMKEAASGAVEKPTEAAGSAKARAGEGTSSALATARARARDEVDRRSTLAGDRAVGAAGDIRSVGDELRKQGKDAPARVAERAADQVERAGAYLRDNDADALLGDVERVGREQPWAVAAAAFALGIVAARALKASSAKRYSHIPGGVGPDADARPAGLGVPDPHRPSGLGGR